MSVWKKNSLMQFPIWILNKNSYRFRSKGFILRNTKRNCYIYTYYLKVDYVVDKTISYLKLGRIWGGIWMEESHCLSFILHFTKNGNVFVYQPIGGGKGHLLWTFHSILPAQSMIVARWSQPDYLFPNRILGMNVMYTFRQLFIANA